MSTYKLGIEDFEEEVFIFLMDSFSTMFGVTPIVKKCTGMDYDEYKDFYLNHYKRKTVLFIGSPYRFAGKGSRNDFSIYSPKLAKSYAIECKHRTTSTINPNEAHKQIQFRLMGETVEDEIYLLLNGNYTDLKKENLQMIEKGRVKLIYSISDLILK